MGILMSLPLMGYELSNGQNKMIALCFMLAAILFFEKKKMLLAAISFSLALTIYVALAPFVLYFLIKEKRFIFGFIAGALLIFLIIPSLIFGTDFNIFLLKQWFIRCLKPFFLTTSYATYIDMRASSQSLPSAIGRMLASGHTGTFQYLIPPLFIHILIRFFSALIVFFSCIALWKSSKPESKGLGIAIFLMLALILPQYCIYYTWAWLFVFYFAVLNYISFPSIPDRQKKILRALVIILFIASWGISIHVFNLVSVLFWATLALWAGMVVALV